MAAGQTCDSEGVTDQTSCSSKCSGTNCLCGYTEVNGVGSCGCTDGSVPVFSCTDASSISADDDFSFGNDDFSFGDDDGAVPSVDEIRQGLILFLPDGCESAVNSAITSNVIDCFATATSEFSVLNTGDDAAFFSQTALDTVCGSKCISRLLGAVNTLYDAGCLAISDDDTLNTGLDSIFGELGVFEQYEAQLNIACAKGDGNFCGLIFDTLSTYYEAPDTFTANDCMTIVSSGMCLGTIDAALNSGNNLFGDDVVVDTQAFIANLTSTCDSMGVSGVSEAASGTEAPANLASSSATTVSGVVAAVVALVAAAILA